VATPLAFVEGDLNFDKNPRLETVVGFFVHPQPPAKTQTTYMIKTRKKATGSKKKEIGPARNVCGEKTPGPAAERRPRQV